MLLTIIVVFPGNDIADGDNADKLCCRGYTSRLCTFRYQNVQGFMQEDILSVHAGTHMSRIFYTTQQTM